MIDIVLSFSSFSQAQMIFVSVVLMGLLFGSIRLYSPFAIVMWAITAITLVGVMEFSLDMIYFWFTVILNVIAIAISLTIRATYSATS